jgi:SAM-dependent methyltransferase
MATRAAAEIVTGAKYAEQITALEADRRARSAFLRHVTRLASPGATVFDFGAGPGLDARFYAQHGYLVAAYDVDPAMCEFFADHCRDFIDAGRITLSCSSYREFLACDTCRVDGEVELVTANFAPLNLIDDLRPLFARFHSLTSPEGKVLASVLSPYFLGDLKYGWWWRNLPRLWRNGHFSVPGAQAPIVRRRLTDYAAQSAPYFTLQRVFRGLPSNTPADDTGIDVGAGAQPFTALRLSTCQFMFLLFERRKSGTVAGHHCGGHAPLADAGAVIHEAGHPARGASHR